MSEELLQKGYTEQGDKFGIYEFYNLGNTNLEYLKKYKIVTKKDYGNYKLKKPDAILVDRRNKEKISVIVVIEHKSYNELDTPKKKELACKQCNNYCELLGAKIGIVTDTKEYIWINPQIDVKKSEIRYEDDYGVQRGFAYILKEDGYPLSDHFVLNEVTKTDTQKTLKLLQKILTTIDINNSKIAKETKLDPSNLAKRVWQAIWLASGENPDVCLATFVEIFLFRFLSDLGVLTKNEWGVPVDFETTVKSGRDICLKYYFNNVRDHIKILFPENEKDGTSIINNFILNPEIIEHNHLFYDILLEFQNFLKKDNGAEKLENINPEFKTRLYEDFLKRSISQKNWGQFFTPRNIVKAIIEMSNIEHLPDGAKVGDPACGVGGFVLEPILTKRTSDYYFEEDKLQRKIEYVGFDRDPKTIILGKANMVIYLSDLVRDNPSLTVEFAKMLGKTFESKHRSTLGSLGYITENEYDLIMTNPPYVTKGIINYKNAIEQNGRLKDFYTINAMGTEGFFLQKIVKELKPKRKAFVIVPDGFLNRVNDYKMREFIKKNCIIDGIISLPQGTFYTTLRKTYILCLTKKDNSGDQQTDHVFTYLVSNIGETLDVYRAKTSENDLKDTVKQFNYFMTDKNGFEPFNLRCKLFGIDKFDPASHWCVDRWWTKEEKIDLGIEEKVEVLSIDEFSLEMKTVSNKITEITKETDELMFFVNQSRQSNLRTVLLVKLFDIKQGNAYYTKKRIIENVWQGEVPVYSSNTKNNGLLIRIREEYIQDKDKYYDHCLTWSVDGVAGTVFVRNQDNKQGLKEKKYLFTANNHCGLLIPKEECKEKIDLTYIKTVLQPIFYEKSKCYGNKKLGTNQIIDVEIPIPINNNGEFDLEKQKEIAASYKKLEDIKRGLADYLSDLSNVEVRFD